MNAHLRWSRVLCIAGVVAMLMGCLDPLEGSLIILPGSGLAALGAFFGRSRHRRLALWAFGATAVGVAILFALSAAGGMGGSTGRSYWWTLAILPYPAGAILAIVTGVRVAVEYSRRQRLPGGNP